MLFIPYPVQGTYVFLLICRVVEDVVHSGHLGKNGAIAERVPQCSHPGSYLATGWYEVCVCSCNCGGGGAEYRDFKSVHLRDTECR